MAKNIFAKLIDTMPEPGYNYKCQVAVPHRHIKNFCKGELIMKFFYNGYNFKVVTNKKLKSYFEIFQNISGVKSVFTIYGRPSQHKINACWTCFYLESKLYGYAGRILTHNTNMFTYGFVFYYINKKYFMVITKNNINSDTFEVLDITKE